jgi:hypothetical protein
LPELTPPKEQTAANFTCHWLKSENSHAFSHDSSPISLRAAQQSNAFPMRPQRILADAG